MRMNVILSGVAIATIVLVGLRDLEIDSPILGQDLVRRQSRQQRQNGYSGQCEPAKPVDPSSGHHGSSLHHPVKHRLNGERRRHDGSLPQHLADGHEQNEGRKRLAKHAGDNRQRIADGGKNAFGV